MTQGGAGVHVHRSHRTEDLADALAALLAERPSPVFEPETIAVPSRGMERWLAMRLAQRLGVCANVRFPFPGRVLGEVFEAVLGDGAASSEAWSPDRLAWSIIAVLPGLLDDPAFAPLARYLADCWPKAPALSRRPLRLARDVADVFDRYATWRPEMVAAWSDGEGDDWQPRLWRALRERCGPTDPATLRALLLRRLAEGPPPALPARLCLFGLSALPPFYLEVLHALSAHVEIHLFCLAPSAGAGEHPLRASWGRLGSEFLALLDEIAAPSAPPPAPAAGDTMLARLQADVLTGAAAGRDGRPGHVVAPGDASVRVHACHGPMRQVEVLRDALLACFAELPDLQPRDVVVMTPDIETYAPLIDAVFGDGDAAGGEGECGFPRLPYRVADRAMRRENPVAEAALCLLRLASGRATASAVLDFVGHEPVRRRSGLEAEDVTRVAGWVAQAGVRWGLDAEDREGEGLPRDPQNTWRAGLERLLLGHALRGEGHRLFRHVLPSDGVDDARRLGAFADACDALFEALRSLRPPRPLPAWRDDLSAAMDRLMDADPAWQHQQVREALNDAVERAGAAGVAHPVDRDALLALLEQPFGVAQSVSHFLSGAITFCELIPMRSVPFRVVCLLGMDDGVFPRLGARPGFDVVAAERRPGDRDPRDDDRHLVLEALLSARDRLLVTFTGFGIRDNEPRPPAVPVAELIDEVVRSFRPAGDAAPADLRRAMERLVVVEHPLQPFSPRNFAGDKPACHDRRLLAAARHVRGAHTAPPPFVSGRLPEGDGAAPVVRLDDLARFFEHPPRGYLTQALGLVVRDDAVEIADCQPTEVDPLERWALGQDLLTWRVEEPAFGDGLAALRASGRLPPGRPGDCVYGDLAGQVEAIADQARALRDGPPGTPLTFVHEVAGCRVTGRVGALYPAGRVRYQFSRVSKKHLLGEWVRHVALHAAVPEIEAPTLIVGRREKGDGLTVARYRRPDDAAATLARLVELYRDGLRAPLPFLPEASHAYAAAILAGKDEAAALDAATKAWREETTRYEGDEAVERVFGAVGGPLPAIAFDGPGAFPFAEVALAIWAPALACLEG